MSKNIIIMRSITLFLFVMIVAGCNQPGNNTAIEEDSTGKEAKNSPAPFLVFDKLIGTWQEKDGKNFERWTKNEDGTYRSVAFSIQGKDTSWNYQAHIYPEKENWIFENNVKGQNDGKSVRFTSSLLNENSVQFSNPAHDFPTDVIYTVTNENTVNAFIIGPNNKGGKDTIPFDYIRTAGSQ